MMTIMRYPDEHKSQVRARIVQGAAKALRKHGLQGIGVPALMKQAGLTHGGFYVHFKNRDELVAEAVRLASAETRDAVLTKEGGVETYLSPEHLAHPEHGCVVAALGTEGARQPPAVRKAFAHAAKGLISLIGSKSSKGGTEPSDLALVATSLMVGAVVLARLVDDERLSKRILTAAKKAALQ
jgi:TetR/AcrR family transcriptional repressor of nem operon